MVSILEVAKALTRLYNKEIEPEITNNYRAGDIRHCFADISRIKNKLGFESKVAFEEGIKELVAWGEKEEAMDTFDEAHEELLRRGLVEE